MLLRIKELEQRLATTESSRDQLEQQLAVARSQLADTRALMDSTQVGFPGRRESNMFGVRGST